MDSTIRQPAMPDQFSSLYAELLDWTCDCTGGIVLNARFRLGRDGGEMRFWWRQLYGSGEQLDTPHLMRMAGRFSRRLRACCKTCGIPVQDCLAGEQKWKIGQQHVCSQEGRTGLFRVLVSRTPAPVWEWPRIIAQLREILRRFTEVVRSMDASFVADDVLERLPEPGQVGATKAGGIDINKLRMRRLMGAALAPSSLPQGFTVCEVAAKAGQAADPSALAYGPRQAAYDLRKLRSKGLMERTGNSRRYAVTWAGLRTLTALLVLRDKVIQPLLANAGQRRRGARPAHTKALDGCYDTLRIGMQALFKELGVAAGHR